MDNLQQLIQSISPHQWFLIGGLVAANPGVVAITEWVKRRHFKVKAEELWSGFVVLNVTVWSFVLTATDAVLNNLGQLSHIGSLIPQIAPFVAHYAPTVSVVTLTLHSLATALSKWWEDRREKRRLDFINGLPDLSPAVQAVTGQQLAPQPVATSVPPDNLFS